MKNFIGLLEEFEDYPEFNTEDFLRSHDKYLNYLDGVLYSLSELERKMKAFDEIYALPSEIIDNLSKPKLLSFSHARSDANGGLKDIRMLRDRIERIKTNLEKSGL